MVKKDYQPATPTATPQHSSTVSRDDERLFDAERGMKTHGIRFDDDMWEAIRVRAFHDRAAGNGEVVRAAVRKYLAN
jgi:hypothetical protein